MYVGVASVTTLSWTMYKPDRRCARHRVPLAAFIALYVIMYWATFVCMYLPTSLAGAPAVGYICVYVHMYICMYCLVFFISCREAQRGQERPRVAQRVPEKPREAQSGPERPREAQRAAERHRDAQRGPERPREAVCTSVFVYIAAVSELHWMGTAV